MIQIDDPSVSDRHAQLLLIDDRYQLKDLDSTNGTRVNSESVTDVFLRVGDRIRFGKVEARYESHATGEAQPLPDAGEIEQRRRRRAKSRRTSQTPRLFRTARTEKDTVGDCDPGGGGPRHSRFPLQHARPVPDSRPALKCGGPLCPDRRSQSGVELFVSGRRFIAAQKRLPRWREAPSNFIRCRAQPTASCAD